MAIWLVLGTLGNGLSILSLPPLDTHPFNTHRLYLSAFYPPGDEMRRGPHDTFEHMTIVNPGNLSGRAPSAPWPEPDRAIYSPTGQPSLFPQPSAPSWGDSNQPTAPSIIYPVILSEQNNQPDTAQRPPSDPGHHQPEPVQNNQTNNQTEPSQSDASYPSYQQDIYIPAHANPPMLYSAELIIFGFVGWAWLAVREYIGRTPVLDATVILSTLICSCLSLIAVLLVPSPAAYAPFAQAYFSHALAICILYAYGLAESTAPNSPIVACGTSNATVSTLYAKAYFGGLPIHQAPASVTMAYLIVVLLLSATQANACVPIPRRWFLNGLTQSASIFLILHLSLYALNTPLQDPLTPFAGGLIGGLCTLLLVCMTNIGWALSFLFPNSKRNLSIIQGCIEMGLVGMATVLCNVYCASLAKYQPSVPLLTSFTLLLLLSVLLFANEFSRPDRVVPSAVATPAPARQGQRVLNLNGFLMRSRARMHEGKNK